MRSTRSPATGRSRARSWSAAEAPPRRRGRRRLVREQVRGRGEAVLARLVRAAHLDQPRAEVGGWIIGPIGLLVLNAQMMVAGGWAEALEAERGGCGGRERSRPTRDDPARPRADDTIAFAVGAAKLASRQVLVNELPAVEGLARVDIICLDKTGTLTAGDIEFDGAHPLAATPPRLDDVLAWYGAAPDANATARCLREPYPGAARARAARRASRSPRRASGARSPSPGGGTWVLGPPRWCSRHPRRHGCRVGRVVGPTSPRPVAARSCSPSPERAHAGARRGRAPARVAPAVRC